MSLPDDDVASDKKAPWFNVPFEPVMSVEHPCIVKNSMKGIEMLGGSRALSQTLSAGIDRTLALSFNPRDLASRSILSLHNKTNNVLLKITVPKRTGRKRKRGSADEFHQDSTHVSDQRDASYLLTSMRENPNRYAIEPVGSVSSAHVFRNMPDLVYSTKGSTFLRNIEEHVLPQNYSRLKDYSLPHTFGLTDTETIPPPVFSTQSLPYHYMYRQNPVVQSMINSAAGDNAPGHKITTIKTFTHQWQYNAEVPTSPLEGCPPLEYQPQQLREIVAHMERLFEERPIWTRRAVHNRLPDDASIFLARYALAYVAYTVRSGPWRDALIKFGVDPRTDRKYRKYQTILLQMAVKGKSKKPTTDDPGRQWTRGDDRNSHVFTGTGAIHKDGKVWQLCDLHDEQLKRLVEIPDLYIRSECEVRYFGWYPNGTFAKLRIILKAKADGLMDGKPVEPEKLEFLMKFPEIYNTFTGQTDSTNQLEAAYVPKGSGLQAIEWAAAYRGICGTPLGSVPTYGAMGKGRFSIAKPKARPSYIATDGDQDLVGGQPANVEERDGDGDEDEEGPDDDGADDSIGAEDDEDDDEGANSRAESENEDEADNDADADEDNDGEGEMVDAVD